MRVVPTFAAAALLVVGLTVRASAQSAPTFLGSWGRYGTGTGQLNYPYGIVVSADGYLYVSDQYNFRIVKYTTDGQVVTSWGTHGSGNGQFLGTIGLGLDASGNVYVADYGNNRVQVFDRNGVFQRWWGEVQARDVAIAPDGFVHVISGSSREVDVFYPTGEFVRRWAVGAFGSPTSIAIDASGFVYVADEGGELNSEQESVSKWSPQGTKVASWGSAGVMPGQFGGLAGLAVDAAGKIYTVEHTTNRVQVLNSAGDFVSLWGTTGGGPGQFNEPVDIALDPAGRIYVVDMYNHRIEKFGSLPVPTVQISWGRLKARYR